MAEKNPEPAFPGAVDVAAPPGMSLRDYFAGQALIGLLANPKELSEGNEDGWSWRTGSLAGDAYQFADQMLEARSK